jgi:hypothetical protein
MLRIDEKVCIPPGRDNISFSHESLLLLLTIMRLGYYLVMAIAAILFAAPVSATYLLTNTTFQPDAPLIAGSSEHVTATYALLPTGSTTFVRGHVLQMQTGLTGARWNIQVIVDGRNAAQQTASGNAAFVSGDILSYPTSHDVTLVVTIDGTVPTTESDQLMLLQVEEIDNSGTIVPGSVIAINQPLATPSPSPVMTTVPVLTPIPATSMAPTRSPGLTAVAGIIAIGTVMVLLSRRST